MDKRLFDDAREYCAEKGWRLFGEYNGTQKQVDWLLKDFVYTTMYLGISKQAGHSEWVSDKGEVMTQLILRQLNIFEPSTANKIYNHEKRIVFKQEDTFSHTIKQAPGTSNERNFICVIVD